MEKLNQRTEFEPCALRDALDAIASPSRPEDYGWWTQVARRALGVATARETALPPSALQSAIDLIADDSYAITFQTMSQYRTAVLGILRGKQPAQPPAVHQAACALVDAIEREGVVGDVIHNSPGWVLTARSTSTKESE